MHGPAAPFAGTPAEMEKWRVKSPWDNDRYRVADFVDDQPADSVAGVSEHAKAVSVSVLRDATEFLDPTLSALACSPLALCEDAQWTMTKQAW